MIEWTVIEQKDGSVAALAGIDARMRPASHWGERLIWKGPAVDNFDAIKLAGAVEPIEWGPYGPRVVKRPRK